MVTLIVRPRTARTPSFDRSALVPGVDRPSSFGPGGTLSVGCPPEMIAGLDDVTGVTTITSDNEDLVGYRFLDRIDIRAENVKVRKSQVLGPLSAPSGDSQLIACTNLACVNALIEDVTISPRFPHWQWDSGVVGHDMTLRRVLVENTTDGVNVFNLPLWQATGSPYQTNTVLEMVWQRNLGYWTATGNGVVHPNDNVTHNDGCQHQGGLGTVFRGSEWSGVYSRQYGHWFTVGQSLAEPYSFVPLNSLGAGAPGYGGPYVASPDRGSGTAATGRYNVGGLGSLAAIMIGDEVGPSGNLLFDRNWIIGGEYAVNGGGALNPGGAYTMTFTGNRFDRSQGNQSKGQINFEQGEHSWTGRITATGNVYLDNGATVPVWT